MSTRRILTQAAILLSLSALVLPGARADVVWNGSNGADLWGSAVFYDVTGGTLQMDLFNVSPEDVGVPSQVLTGIFFDITGSPTMTSGSATLAPGSVVHFGTTDPGNGVGGEWAYNGALGGGLPQYGISSTGLDWFGAGTFGGTNLQGPDSVNGLQYGITSIGDDVSTGNTPVTGTNALIQYGVSFTLTGLEDNFDLSRINNVWFQYGTSLTEPRIPGVPDLPPGNPGPPGSPAPVPEPSSMALIGLGVVPLVKKLRNRHKN